MTQRPGQLPPHALNPARTLVELVRKQGGRPILMMTWTYRGSESRLSIIQRNFENLNQELQVPVAPVGEAFALASKKYPEVQLLQADGVHATLAGAYLAAAVLFATISEHSPVGGEAPSELDPALIRQLQELAWSVSQFSEK